MRRADRTALLPVNRLLASWGRDVRELELVLATTGARADHYHALPPGEPRTLLETIQADIREDRQPPGSPLPGVPDPRPRLRPDDRSVQIHACHGRARQVEVLRDAVLHLLEDDPTLEPRDVIVMCPDIEAFAPLIQATFGAGRAAAEDDGEDGGGPERRPDLRVRLADRSLRQTNPVLGVVSHLLALADQRATASQLLDLAAREPVRRRFALDDDDLTRMQDWVAASGIRWGFDAAHREPFKLGMLSANTWRKGIDRVLTGVAMTEEDQPFVTGVLPLDDVESGAIDLAGRFAEFVDRARAAVDALSNPKPIHEWTEAIAEAADALTATSDRESWQRRELQRLLADVDTESADETGRAARSSSSPTSACSWPIGCEGVRPGRTSAPVISRSARSCPMRSVPHRVVCVLGLDDGEYPRRARRDGDDVMLAEPHVGDRDPRAEDRQMLLDALIAATERLIITYTGRRRAHEPAPAAGGAGRRVARHRRPDRQLRHGLGPRPGRDPPPVAAVRPPELRGRPSSCPTGRGGSIRRRSPARGRSPGSARRVRRSSRCRCRRETIPWSSSCNLIRFVEHPVRALLRDRLGISVGEYFDEVQDAIPVELDALEEWGVGQRLLDGVLGGAELRECMQAEIARGTLPPGELARPTLARIGAVVGQLAGEAKALGDQPPRSLDVHVVLPDGRTLAGTVTGVCGDTVRAISYSRVRPRDRLRAWVRLLALSAAYPDRPFESAVIGRARADARWAGATTARIPPLSDEPEERRQTALGHLAVLLDLYDRGMREPLPLACDASAAYAQAVVAGEDRETAVAAAREAWETVYRFDKEDRQPEHILVYGDAVPLARVLDTEPASDERGPGWDETETTRFGRCALRLWRGLLAIEALSDR